MLFLAAEHFVRAPDWLWFILLYFFFAGLAGGSYVLATLLRLTGDVRDEPAARIGYYIALPAIVICPLLLTADLGVSWTRFWHMLVDVTPGQTSPIFHYWSPMSTGAWALLVFGFFALVSAVDARAWFIPRFLSVPFAIIGSLFGLFIASYTG
ncbi:MAG TPA: NrfD/PsrC family molybdoenzyme membrane anchor subunit, partial [Candidatus Dormibacteraeota bacterium]|nr:NrfD/PsrC family molybdoenzyme membrane anchor subunit [Candidatus Dormibacteraeota bacterium]